MSDTPLMTCEQLDERLSDWLERDLDAVTRVALEQHAAACPRCAGLIADLASLRHAAASLPELVPSRDLWPGIEARIEAPVVALDRGRAPRFALRRSKWWMGAAAAGLVAVTAAVTYVATTQVTSPPTIAVADPAITRSPDTVQPEPLIEPESTLASEPPRTDAQVPAARVPSGQGAARPVGSSRSDVSEASEYSRDVAQLRAIVTQRRADFDSTTIAVLEKNLELIDRAIAESRAALQRDPASEFLADQLARAMTKKVAILRTAALLPARS